MIDVELNVALANFCFGASFTASSCAVETSQQLDPKTSSDNIFFITLILIFIDTIGVLLWHSLFYPFFKFIDGAGSKA